MHNVWITAAEWVGVAFLASLLSIRIGVSVALVEIVLGVLAGNTLGFRTNDWINFLASFGAVLLTFLAGAEIDPASLRQHLKASLSIGTIAFLFPFLGAFVFVLYLAGWNYHRSLIAGIALSTTSVAVVYAVLVENGLNASELGKLILAACFVNDLGTVLALGGFFANFDIWMLVFATVTTIALCLLPTSTRYLISWFGAERVSEPEVKFLFLVLCALGALATRAKSEAVLPAYVAGLVVAGVFHRDRILVNRMRIDRVCDADAVLFYQGGAVRFASGAASERGAGCASAGDENGYEVCRRVAARRGVRPPSAGAELHYNADVHRAYVRHHLSLVRPGE